MTSPATVSVPASSANLGPGFDALGLALTLRATLGTGPTPPDAHLAEETHPAAVAHRAGGGDGRVWVRSQIPMGRGLGYSGAMRVGGAALAMATTDPGVVDRELGGLRADAVAAVIRIAGQLEGHADNAAASAVGGVVVTSAGHSVRVDTPLDPGIVVWIPRAATSTNRSRAALPEQVPFVDAVANISRAALLVAALAAGRIDLLRDATVDRLHQDRRLALIDGASEILAAGLEAGAWCGWLSGSGPTLAFMTDAGGDFIDVLTRRSEEVGADATLKLLAIDRSGLLLDVE